ncbi:hypothetical protein L901_06985 [Agrobacterium sp. D14]|nr:hypothetical protein L901_06985 [Agrobacterium sp. D14]
MLFASPLDFTQEVMDILGFPYGDPWRDFERFWKFAVFDARPET